MQLALKVAAGIVLSLAASTGTAGTAEPFGIRVVTMDGRTGPAFYSVVEGRYRFTGSSSSDRLLFAGY